ncbi:MAG: STAS domain-containing protein [Ectothiorhodospiraceae bacterium]|nr:STAS domain-containing protein [Ectothiorhodospiraceae bacterium]MCH8503848.1 STAS domain-containing protein [Ectothiorhodospiraceae bacterium]
MTDATAPDAVLESTDGGRHFRVRGELGLRSARGLWQQGLQELASGPMTVDLEQVVRADSAGLAVLVAWTRESRTSGQPLSFVNIPAQLRNLALVCGVESLLSLGRPGDEAEAR